MEAVANYENFGFCVSTWKSQERKPGNPLLWLHLTDSELQNVTEAGRDLGDHLVQHTPLKAMSAARAQGCVRSGFEYCQGWNLRSLSGQTVPVFKHSPPVQKIYRTNVFLFLCC